MMIIFANFVSANIRSAIFQKMEPRKIELLAPARNADIAIEAIRHGADAVYMGASSHGARSAAGNSIADISRVVEFAHQFGAKVYVTVNTIIYDDELATVDNLIDKLYRIGVDALIVQDMALLRLNLPPIALHASTQTDIRDVAKARFLSEIGFSQLVVAREMTLDEMSEIHRNVPGVDLEAFVHGALCVSYSGDCQAGFATMGRSANRGECPQICRHKFDLTDGAGNRLISGKHLLSLRDLNRSAHIAAMLDAGISSLKIEGRLKDMAYVKNVVGAYSRLLDNIIAANPERYRRSSMGTTRLTFTPDLNKSFNRGYTDYFTTSARPSAKMASFDTPKWIGVSVGKVISCNGTRLHAHLSCSIANGDGLGFFNSKREFCGFRVNRVEGDTLILHQPLDIPAGTTLFRNSDRLYTATLEGDTAKRTIDLDMTLRPTSKGVSLEITDDYGHRASATATMELSEARTPQADSRLQTLSRMGDTIYNLRKLNDLTGNLFIPRSSLASLRRDAIAAFDRAKRATYRFDYRRAESPDAKLPSGTELSRHENIANRYARQFYSDHGATSIHPAMETAPGRPAKGERVMTTRYCLRRECDRCLLTPQGKLWPRDLYLQSGPMRFALDFECHECRMHVSLA